MTVVNGLLHRAKALLLFAVVIAGGFVSGLTPRLDKGLNQRVVPLAPRHMQGAIGAAPRRIAAVTAIVPRLHPFEVGQHIRIAPTMRARLGPMVVIHRVAAHIDHAVDRRGPANDLAARTGQTTTAQMRFGVRPIAPVITAHVHRIGQGGGHLDEGPRIGAAKFQNQNGIGSVLGQAIGHSASGRARADNHEICGFLIHRHQKAASVGPVAT